MDPEAHAAGLSSDAPAEGCAHCRACPQCGAGALPDAVTQDNLDALAVLRDLGVLMLQTTHRKVAATGEVTDGDRAVLVDAGRSVRQTTSVIHKINGDAKKTPAQRHEENLRRIDAQENARFRLRRATLQRAIEGEIEAEVARRGVPGDRENLLADMHERLLDPSIDRADTPMEISAILLRICQGMGITPRNEIWSDALMQYEIHRTNEQVRNAVAAHTPPEGVVPTVPVPEPQGPGEEVKIGSVTFNPDGSFKCRDFDPPEEDWPEDILHRPPIDLLQMRQKGKPPDTG